MIVVEVFLREKERNTGRVVVQVLLVGLVLFAGITAARYLVATKPEAAPRKIVERIWTVDVLRARKQTVTPQRTLYGTIVAGREVELRPLVSGRVVAIGRNFSDGAAVRKGDLLVRIDPFDYEAQVKERAALLRQAQARGTEIDGDLTAEKGLLGRDQDDLDLRVREVERRQKLRKSGTGSQKALDDSIIARNQVQQKLADRRKRILSLTARREQQKAVIAQAEIALARAKRDLARTVLRAPVDGFLRNVANTAVGKRVGVQDVIARLTDAHRLEARFLLSEATYARLQAGGKLIGRQVIIQWKTTGQNRSFAAKIQRVFGRIAAADGGVGVYATVDKSDITTVLRPGLFVQIVLKDQTYKDVFRLPDEAVRDNKIVYVIRGGRLVARKVTVVGQIGADLLVRGDIGDGDQLVATLFPEIGPGARVTAR